MTKLITATSVALLALVSLTSAANAAPREDCAALWTKADAKGEGKLTGDTAKPYLMAMEDMKMPASMAKDGSVADKEFMEACMKDAFKAMK